MSDEHPSVTLKRLRDTFAAFGDGPANTQDIAALDAAIAALGGVELYGWVAPSTGQYFEPSEVAATERTRELIAQGELVRVYALPAPPSKEG